MKLLITNTILSAMVVAVVAAFWLFTQQPHVAEAANVAVSPQLYVATTTASSAITTSARIMATTTNVSDPSSSYVRVYASICNPNANPVYLNMNQDKAANVVGGSITTVIAAAAGYNACYEITDKNLYQGSITASSTNQTSTTIFYQQFVQ